MRAVDAAAIEARKPGVAAVERPPVKARWIAALFARAIGSRKKAAARAVPEFSRPCLAKAGDFN
jgi:hypothetical protein